MRTPAPIGAGISRGALPSRAAQRKKRADPLSGRDVVADVVCPARPPGDIASTEADAYLTFAAGVSGFRHPELGTVGPFPYRRTGGHTGDWGFLYVSDPGAAPGDRGMAEAFDVAAAVLDLVGAAPRPELSGTSLGPRLISSPH